MDERTAIALPPDRPTGMSRGMLALCLAGAAVVHGLLWWLSEPPTLFSDFYKAYFPAAEHVLEHGLSASWPFTEAGAGGFVNMPIVVVMFLAFVPLGEGPAGWVFLAAGLAAVAASLHLLAHVARCQPMGRCGLALAALVLVNGPLVNSLREGNVTHLVLLLLTGAVLLLRSGHERIAGVLIGISGIVKLPLLLLVAYLLVRRRWDALLGAIGTIAAAAALSLAVFGMAAHVEWLQTSVLPFLNGVIPAFNVQSLDGFLVRLTTGADHLRDWEPMARASWHQIVRVLLLAGLIGAILAAFRAPAPAGVASHETRELELGSVLLLAIVSSPIAWTHYYQLLLLPWATLLPALMAGTMPALNRRLIIASMVLTSLPVVDLPQGPELVRSILARTVLSAWLFGGLSLLAALLLTRAHGTITRAAGAEPPARATGGQ